MKKQYKGIDGAVRGIKAGFEVNPPMWVHVSHSRILARCEKVRGVSVLKTGEDDRIWISGPAGELDPDHPTL